MDWHKIGGLVQFEKWIWNGMDLKNGTSILKPNKIKSSTKIFVQIFIKTSSFYSVYKYITFHLYTCAFFINLRLRDMIHI